MTRISVWLQIAAVIIEFLLPWILKGFYPGYDSRKMAMSNSGLTFKSCKQPLQCLAYCSWPDPYLCLFSIFLCAIRKNSSCCPDKRINLSVCAWSRDSCRYFQGRCRRQDGDFAIQNTWLFICHRLHGIAVLSSSEICCDV